MYEIKFEFRSVGLCGGFLFVSLSVPFFTSLPAYVFIYLFLPFFIFYFFALSLCHSFYFFSIFLEPEPKLFPCYVGKQITLTFYFLHGL